ncbi:hypothetical protein [Bacillus gaemokensis]|uniref:Uncharacterized protein n=1 Tax=Bacillus gaemokensis TaxID=574375 RepID=A0A073KC48_9BACI|nr:hypothetical protein [Bacillus gaemokensis]KEK24022.1 hypothetical protein BAGA_04740 [Bacillus gaemokensis]KYG27226.1 hypothetical protein AZF08_15890 [Bacillus gaemokensis]
MIYTKVVMNSGIEYVIPLNPIKVISEQISNKEGELYNTFIHLIQKNLETEKETSVFLNPQHISSIEEVKVNMKGNDAIPPVFKIDKNK